MSQQWQTVCNTVFDLTGPRFQPRTLRSEDKHVTAWPTGHFLANWFISFLMTTKPISNKNKKITVLQFFLLLFLAVEYFTILLPGS